MRHRAKRPARGTHARRGHKIPGDASTLCGIRGLAFKLCVKTRSFPHTDQEGVVEHLKGPGSSKGNPGGETGVPQGISARNRGTRISASWRAGSLVPVCALPPGAVAAPSRIVTGRSWASKS